MMEEMQEYLMNSIEEMKRADHLLYVSLKYTRTVEVILSLVQRLINTYDWIWEGLLLNAQQEEKITTIPQAPQLKVAEVKKLYADQEELLPYFEFYLFLRSVNRGTVGRSNEYRRHVTLTAGLEDKRNVDVTIDIVGDYFHRTQAFLDLIKRILYGVDNDD